MNDLKLQFIFVHGLSGWGSYDKINKRMPYWGMRGADLMDWLRRQGFDCYAASVSPTGSAWDRACELYAQLAGARVDYGEKHSSRCGHGRFGTDFSVSPLISSFNENSRLVLLGHSFGGTTVRLLSELLAHGDEEERKSKDASPLFLGGMENRIHSLITLASPMNGTTAYDLFLDPSFDPKSVKVPLWSKGLAALMARGTRPKMDQRATFDYADYDMHIDHALEINERISTLPSVYYFSVPCCATEAGAAGRQVPKKKMEPLFVMRAYQIGAYKGTTIGGRMIDESWRKNDGLVNTISERCPEGAQCQPLDRDNIVPGIWNVFPDLDADHMWLQGGLLRKHEIRAFYLDLLTMIKEVRLQEYERDCPETSG